MLETIPFNDIVSHKIIFFNLMKFILEKRVPICVEYPGIRYSQHTLA